MEKKPFELKADEKGNVTLTVEQLESITTQTAQAAVENLVKELALNQAPRPGVTTGSGDDYKALAIEPKDETRSAKRARLQKAAIAVSSMKLAVEDAPKQIKLNRFLAAQYDGDRQTVLALGRGSYTPEQAKALTEGSATDGGNLVPVEFATDLLVAIENYGICARDCMIVPMTSNEKDLRTVTTKPSIARKGELVASAEGAPKFGKPQLTVDMYTGHQIISREEMDDNNVGLYDRLVDLYGEQLAYAQDYEGLVGTYYPSVIGSKASTTNTTLLGTAFTDISYSKLVELVHSLSPGQLMGGGKLYMHRTIYGLIEGMEDTQGRPIAQNTFGPLGPTILGHPVELSEVMPAASASAADTAFIIFGNLEWLALGQRQGIFTQLLREATLAKAGGGSVNLAEQRAIALAVDTRWGFKVTIASNLALLCTKA